MSKPSYAAVAAQPPSKSGGGGGGGGGGADSSALVDGQGPSTAGQADAPPPYSAPTIPSQHPTHPHLHAESQPQPDENGWTPPASAQVAAARARRRFWVAFFWAWAIWIVLGMLVGGGVSDVEDQPTGRHGHWDKHGDWHNDWVASFLSGSTGTAAPLASS